MSIDSSSLNIFSSSFLHLQQIIERTNVFSKIFKFSILAANNAIQFFQVNLLVIENILVLFYHSSHNYSQKTNLYILTNIYLLT